jgi:hypothetical protein
MFAATFVACMVYAGICNQQGKKIVAPRLGLDLRNLEGPYFFGISIGGACIFFFWQFSTWQVDDVADCGSKFEVGAVCFTENELILSSRPMETWD